MIDIKTIIMAEKTVEEMTWDEWLDNVFDEHTKLKQKADPSYSVEDEEVSCKLFKDIMTKAVTPVGAK
jgi:hypothetical protein